MFRFKNKLTNRISDGRRLLIDCCSRRVIVTRFRSNCCNKQTRDSEQQIDAHDDNTKITSVDLSQAKLI